MASVRSLIADATICLNAADNVVSETLRETLLSLARETLLLAAEDLPKPKKYRKVIKMTEPAEEPPVTPTSVAPIPIQADSSPPLIKPKVRRSAFTPWSVKPDINGFRSEMLSFLRGAFPDRDHKMNMAEVAQLWAMYKDVGNLSEIIQSAKRFIHDAIA